MAPISGVMPFGSRRTKEFHARGNNGPGATRQIFQILARRFPDFGFVRSDPYLASMGFWSDNESFGAISVQLLNRQKVSQDFRNRPPLGGGFQSRVSAGRRAGSTPGIAGSPAERRVAATKKRLAKELASCPQGGGLIVIPRRPPGKAPQGF